MPASIQTAPLISLQRTWTTLYTHTLPHLAATRSPVQRTWPVTLDHCFARIILDNAVGIDRPWAEKVKAPATRNMSVEQVRSAIDLGERVVSGDVDLAELNRWSLSVRGKVGKEGLHKDKREAETKEAVPRKKRKVDVEEGDTDIWRRWRSKDLTASSCAPVAKREHSLPTPQPSPAAQHSTAEEEEEPTGDICEALSTHINDSSISASTMAQTTTPSTTTTTTTNNEAALLAIRARIATDPSFTPFRAHVLHLLTQIPRGQHTTYQALADSIPLTKPPRPHPTPSSHTRPTSLTQQAPAPAPPPRTCARAIGSAIRNNPFAPTVPCHRVLAADGRIGGFGGDWGEEGRFAGEKRRLLREEGVRFDGRGKVVGAVWRAFV